MARSAADTKYKAGLLKSSPVLMRLPEDDLSELASRAAAKAYKRGSLIESGDAASVFMIHAGAAAEMQTETESGAATLVRLAGGGRLAGLSGVFVEEGARRGQRFLRALTNVSALVIPAADLLRICRRAPEFFGDVAAELAMENLEIGAKLIAARHVTLEAALSDLLSAIAAFVESEDWQPTAAVGRISQSVLAEMIGARREHVNRTLGMWESSGLVFHNKTGDLIIYNRKRLAALASRPRALTLSVQQDEQLAEIDACLSYGLNEMALQLASEAVKRAPRAAIYKHRAVLAAARAGAIDHALALSETMGLKGDYSDEDISCLRARLMRDKAYRSSGENERRALLAESTAEYEASFKHLGGYYAGINAAAGYALLGETEKARAIAATLARMPTLAFDEDPDEDDETGGDLYFRRATAAECSLIAGERTEAAALFRLASIAQDASSGRKATTRRHLRRLAPHVGIDDAWIDAAVPQATTLYFSGPIAAGGREANNGRIERLLKRLARLLARRRIEMAHGALASGADLVIANALLDAGVKLNVYLPLPPAEFFKCSVEQFGHDWRDLFQRCMREAEAIDWYSFNRRPSRAAFSLGAHIAMGRAVRHAQELEARPLGFFAVRDGGTNGDALSAESLSLWRAQSFEHEAVADDWPRIDAPLADEDEAGFASITLDAVPAAAGSLSVLLGAVAAHRISDADGSLETFLFPSAGEALFHAKSLSPAQELAAARVWLDIGVFRSSALASGAADPAESLLTSACRPETARGGIFSSDAFASVGSLIGGGEVSFEFEGLARLRTKAHPCPMYRVNIF